MPPTPNPRQSRFSSPKGAAAGAAGMILLPGAIWLGSDAAAKGDFKGLSEGAAIRKQIIRQQTAARTAPVKSALVRQKAQAGQNMKPWLAQAKQLQGGAKAAASQDAAKAKQASAPLKAAAAGRAAAAKKAAGADRQAAIRALTPVRSSLVRQKAQAGQNMKPWLEQAKKLQGGVKAAASQDVAKAKQASAPFKAAAASRAQAAKKVASADKQAAMKALAPLRSSLVRQKEIAGNRLRPVKTTIAGDLKGIGKDMSGAKQAAKQSKAASELKQAGAKTNQGVTNVSNRVGRWLAGGKQG